MDKITKIKNNLAFKIISKTLKVVGTIVIILFAALIIIQRVTDNKMTLGGYSVFTVISGSMEPEYHVWDMLIAKKVDTSTIKVGDDVVYLGSEASFKDKIVTHRVIKMRNENGKLYFTTKGTANAIEDPEIEASQVYGKVIYRSVVLCFLSKILNSVYGFYIVIFVPFVIILFFEILSVLEAKKRKERRKRLEEQKTSKIEKEMTIPNEVKEQNEIIVPVKKENSIEESNKIVNEDDELSEE